VSDSTRPGAPLRALGRVFRVLLGIGLTAWLVAEADPRQIVSSLTVSHPAWLVAAVGLVLVDRTLMACRWLLLLRAVDPSRTLPFGGVMRIFFVSTFLGTFLPASVGGDAVRTVGVARLGVRTEDALASVIVDRLLGTLSVLMMGVLGLLVVRHLIDSTALLVVAAALLAAVGGAALLLFDSRWLTRLVRSLTLNRLPGLERLIGRLLGAIRQYGGHRRVLGHVLTASVAVQVLRTLQAWCLGLALGIPVGAVWYFAFIPIVIMAMSLPVTIMGLGTSQLGFQLLFGLVGVNQPDALALSVLFLALGALGNLPGGWLFVSGGPRVGTGRGAIETGR
jgi:uncharacterized protein (TIRG00374 family)